MDPIEYLEELVSGNDLQILDSRIHQTGRSVYLKLVVDTPDGVTVDQLTSLHRRVTGDDKLCDLLEADEIRPEVTSPGVSAGLMKRWQYPRHIGQQLTVRLVGEEQDDGPASINGELLEAGENGIVLKTAESKKEFAWANIEKAQVVMHW
ncbi:MAG: hypothetical protein KAU50_03450 [Candidatus Marinimicrobia bacterium]|nr:hypothetical protein [Candidatus Neomarinimicrobiota bacterium]